MSGIRFALAFFFAMGVVTPAFAQDKGGEDETGAYAVVENWP